MFSISFTCVLLCLKERGMKCLASFFFQSVCRQLQVLITTAKSSSEKGDCGLSATPVIVFSPEKGKRCDCRESRINICWSDETLNVSLQLPLGRGERGGKEGEKEKRKKRNLFIALPYYLMTSLIGFLEVLEGKGENIFFFFPEKVFSAFMVAGNA